MEKKTKHRILGALVVVGLVIISLPLFQDKKETTTEIASIKAPPFPDQSIQVSSSEPVNQSSEMQPDESVVTPKIQNSDVKNNITAQNSQQSANPSSPPMINNTTEANKGSDTKQNAVNENNTQEKTPQNLLQVVRPSVVNSSNYSDDAEENVEEHYRIREIKSTSTISHDQHAKLASAKTFEHNKNNSIYSKTYRSMLKSDLIAMRIKETSHKKAHLLADKDRIIVQEISSDHDDGLVRLKTATWIIQIGSFKKKTNALRLVNHLRANGYPAFIQHVNTALGEHTRVFVGPENKLTSARALASDLTNRLHIKGIVLSYKPLTL